MIYDSADLLTQFNELTGRPDVDAITDASKYQRLTRAQQQIVADIAAICPTVLYPPVAYGAIPQLVTTDNQLFTFGTDSNGYPIAPIGKTGIYAKLGDIPDYPWVEGRDYVQAGATAIRIPNDNLWTDPLYWVGVAPPADISASSEPSLFPEASRELIAVRAAYNFCQEANRNPALAAQLGQRYGYPVLPNPGQIGLFARWCTTWRTQYRTGGVLGWVSGLDVAMGNRWAAPIT